MAEAHDRSSGWIGTVLADKWHIDAKIARGGVATVYRATHRQGQVAAIKIMHPELARNEEVRKRFLREGYAANKVGHPGVVSVLDDDTLKDGTAYIVMELLEKGEVLEDRRERLGGRLPVAEAVDVCAQILDVLAVAHEKGIIHRDIKPENIFVLSDGTVKVLDFGIAHIKEAAKQQEATATGLLLGTPEYMSPEQVLGKRGQIDAATDIYAVGATLFTLVSGESVHVADTLNMLLVQAASRQARSLASVVYKDLPRKLIAVVDKALALEKPRRWPSARAMQLALREAVPPVQSTARGATSKVVGSTTLPNMAPEPTAPTSAVPSTIPNPATAPKGPPAPTAKPSPSAPRLSAPPPRPVSMPAPPPPRPASLPPAPPRPASMKAPAAPRASIKAPAAPRASTKAPAAPRASIKAPAAPRASTRPQPARAAEPIEGPISAATVSTAPATLPTARAESVPPAPPSLPPLSGPTTVIPRRDEGDPWTDEMGADDLDGPTVATTGGPIGGAPAPSVRSEVLARSARPSAPPPPPSIPPDSMGSTQLFRSDEHASLAHAPARASAPPPPPPPRSGAVPSYIPAPPPRDSSGRSIAPPAVPPPAPPLPSLPPPWMAPRGHTMPMMNEPPAPPQPQKLSPAVIAAIAVAAVLLSAIWIGSCLLLQSS